MQSLVHGFTMDVAEEPVAGATRETNAHPSMHRLSQDSNASEEQAQDGLMKQDEGNNHASEHAEKKGIPMPGAIKLIGDSLLDAEFQQKVAEREKRRASQT